MNSIVDKIRSVVRADTAKVEAAKRQEMNFVFPQQIFKPVITSAEAKIELESLSPEIPWAHFYDFGGNVMSVTPEQETFFRKSVGLKVIGEGILELICYLTNRNDLTGLSVLDLACGEGAHSIEIGSRGASVVGVEGRNLYVERAKFAAKAFGLEKTVTFQLGDVRKISRSTSGGFDFTLLLGILHHLGKGDFYPMLKSFHDVTDRIGFLYTHVSSPAAVKNHRLEGPVLVEDKYKGFLFREHKPGASELEKKKKVRASLDNEQSFWAEENTLVSALKDVGFKSVLKVYHPHPFIDPVNQYRALFVCFKGLTP